MKSLLRAETSKIQWSVIILLIAMDMLINGAMGVMQLDDLKEFFTPDWSMLYVYAVNFHSMFFFPLYCGILASLLCMYEHRNGGWKLLLTVPIRKQKIYYSKFIALIGILAVAQLFFMMSYILSGLIADPPGKIPWLTIFYSGIGGWLGILPLAGLQLLISARVRNFGASLALNLCCVVPNIVMTGFHSSIGAWFPFTIPYYVMMPQSVSYAPRVEPYSLILIILITALLYIMIGRREFAKKDW